MNSSHALSRTSSSGFIRKNLVENGLRLRVGHPVLEAFPRFLKLEQLAGDLFAEVEARVFGVFNHAVKFQSGAQQPLALQFVLRELFLGGFLLNDFAVLAFKVIVDRFNPGREESVDAEWRALR